MDVILIQQVSVNPVGDKDVVVPIVVHVEHQRPPTPVRRLHTGQAADLAVCPVPVIQLQRVPRELVIIAVSNIFVVLTPALNDRFRTITGFIFRQHVRHENIRVPVIVDICNIGSHSTQTGFPHLLRQHFPEGAVLIIQVQVIPLKEIVRNINIRPAVSIQVTNTHA